MANLPADMPERLRRWGLTVEIVGGWETRGRSELNPHVVVCHHTGTPTRAGVEFPTRRVLVEGRSDLPGPLCNVGLSATGKVLLVAAGTSNNAGAGGWAGSSANRHTIGIEAENDGSSPWPQAQLDAYDRLAACLCETAGVGGGAVCAHFEWATPKGRKNDPHGFDMAAMRNRVSHLLAHPPGEKPVNQHEEFDMNEATLRAVLDEQIEKACQQGGPVHKLVWDVANGKEALLEQNLGGAIQQHSDLIRADIKAKG